MTEAAVAAPVAPLTPEASQAPITTDTPKAISKERMYTLKRVDGTEEQFPESKILERAQKSFGLEKRVADADKYEKAFNSFVSRVQDPAQLIDLLNHPDLKFDETKQEALLTSMLGSKKPKIIEAVKKWLYENEVKPSMMDPKDRELMETRSEADALRKEKLEREKSLKDAEEEKNTSEIKEAYRVKLGEAYQKSGLPSDDYIVRQVMEKARLYVKAGKHPDFENCCKLVQAELLSQVKAVLGKAEVNNILTLMDGETAQKINKALLSAVDKKTETIETNEKPSKPRKSKELTPQERKKWIKNLERGIID